MARFTWNPDYSSAVDEDPRVLRSTLGDGYTQRAGDGINTDLKVWNLKFERKTSDIVAIRAFLKATGGVSNFDWVDPDGDDLKYVYSKMSRNFNAYGGQVLTVTFTQVPES